jgi:SAM-dependent methyltransferase
VQHEDETEAFWLRRSHGELAAVAAALHRDRRRAAESEGLTEILQTRRTVAEIFLRGDGVEVGAGDRPWPVPERVRCFYGDVRDEVGLAGYFANDTSAFDGLLDAQTFADVPDASLDFVISAHVLEHLPDPVGSIRETMRVLRAGGIFLIAVPDMRHTHDHARPETTVEHLMADEIDGGASTRWDAFEEHVRYVHPLSQPAIPEDEVANEVLHIMAAGMDIHFHAWTGGTFAQLLDQLHGRFGFVVEAHLPVRNESIFVLRKAEAAS